MDSDESGAAYAACFTISDDFPTVNPFQPNRNGEADSTVSKLSPDGSELLYSTYLGGSDFEGQIVGIGIFDHQVYAAGTVLRAS